ncbi:hypothetical protein AMECASPLE_038415 [Ameca splendens]|uniref:Uncharacterized protein n=1 Tax=Ameca splendens TaxID=208324 RepID=A0ABV1A4E8_9TELE
MDENLLLTVQYLDCKDNTSQQHVLADTISCSQVLPVHLLCACCSTLNLCAGMVRKPGREMLESGIRSCSPVSVKHIILHSQYSGWYFVGLGVHPTCFPMI